MQFTNMEYMDESIFLIHPQFALIPVRCIDSFFLPPYHIYKYVVFRMPTNANVMLTIIRKVERMEH